MTFSLEEMRATLSFKSPSEDIGDEDRERVNRAFDQCSGIRRSTIQKNGVTE